MTIVNVTIADVALPLNAEIFRLAVGREFFESAGQVGHQRALNIGGLGICRQDKIGCAQTNYIAWFGEGLWGYKNKGQ